MPHTHTQVVLYRRRLCKWKEWEHSETRAVMMHANPTKLTNNKQTTEGMKCWCWWISGGKRHIENRPNGENQRLACLAAYVFILDHGKVSRRGALMRQEVAPAARRVMMTLMKMSKHQKSHWRHPPRSFNHVTKHQPFDQHLRRRYRDLADYWSLTQNIQLGKNDMINSGCRGHPAGRRPVERRQPSSTSTGWPGPENSPIKSNWLHL